MRETHVKGRTPSLTLRVGVSVLGTLDRRSGFSQSHGDTEMQSVGYALA